MSIALTQPVIDRRRRRRRAPRRFTQPWGYRVGKRAFDIAAVLAGSIVAAPVLAACMLWVRIKDGGPVLYKQWRVGRDGWLFEIYKLRTMKRDAERYSGPQFAADDDPRVIDGCRWMRRSHIDELPQLWNILRGDMSLVGPRPERPEIMENLRHDIPGIDNRLAGAPGLTGLAQVRNGYTNDTKGARLKLAFDLKYLRSRSVLGELRLVLATIPKLWDQRAL